MGPVRLTVTSRRTQSRTLGSIMVLVYAFAGLIGVGTLLLLLPFTQHERGFTPFVDALFTATSAVTVTGLITQDTATYWTRTGQTFILALMFMGGLGFMTIATFLLILIGQRVSPNQRLLVKESLGADQLGGLVRLTVRIALLATAIQLAGFVALLARLLFLGDLSTPTAVWQSAFHAVSGFNNAGFVAFRDSQSLSAFQSDGAVLGTIATLAVLGGISYWVIVDVVKARKFSLFTLNTKLVLVITLLLIVLGAVVFFLSEHDNQATLGPLSIGDKAMISVFESISGRTAGFATVSFGETEQQTNFFFTGLMFVGGASASVAGGIKVNTIAVVLVALLSTVRGYRHASAFGREISQAQIQRAMTIGAVATAFAFSMALLLIFSESGKDFAFIDLLFESVSAFGTVGLTTGLTPDLMRWGHLILVATMFLGRLGPLSLALTMVQRANGDLYRYAQERVTIG